MYYKDIEKFTAFKNVERYGSGSGRKFPLWLLILIIALLVVGAVVIIRKVRSAPTQKMGFRFY
jgi:hypothetical protein